jgi:hypothetical protein
MPPKRTQTRAKATAEDAVSFFQRGSKPTTSQRIQVVKKSPTPSQEGLKSKPSKQSQTPTILTAKEEKNESESTSGSLTDRRVEVDDWSDLNEQVSDEILSDDSSDPQEEDHNSELFTEVKSLPTSTIPSKRPISEIKTVPISIEDGSKCQAHFFFLFELMHACTDTNNLCFIVHQGDLSEDEKRLRLFVLSD